MNPHRGMNLCRVGTAHQPLMNSVNQTRKSTMNQHKNDINNTFKRFTDGNLADNARHLLDILGYRSNRTMSLDPNTAEEFIDHFDPSKTTNAERALLDEWESIDLLFQLTGDEITLSDQPTLGFESSGIDNSVYQSYLFFALKLRGRSYSRTKLSQLTREINKLTPMPAMVVFQHGRLLTFAVIDRRLHRRDESRDVLEKVTLIKDIKLDKPHRAHIDILFDLSHRQRRFSDFNALHEAWKEALDTEALNRDFYKELFKWFEWAVSEAKFPLEETKTLSPQEHVIRLITRLLFVWFLKEKGLVAEELFEETDVRGLLKDYDRGNGNSYYRAVLQNLFFATLNTEIEKREFSTEKNATHRDFSRYRFKKQINDPDKLLELFAQTPFINGGLFDCLDSEEATDDGGYRIDCFSDRHYKKLSLPNRLFFDMDDGLLPLLKHYKFTVEENTPIEQEVALDPELLGKVFENLLAAYNPETGESARKQTGSYYTPRPIVDYMVEEALVATLAGQVCPTNGDAKFWEERLHYLLDYAKVSDDADQWFSDGEADRIVRAISELKILDPAVGSGAFPMGVLHKLTLALRRLDPDNSRWERLQKERAAKRAEVAFDTKDDRTRREELVEIDETFKRYRDSDFGRKLYLIQNSIFGVDIQSIACQIAKLRFFISLAIEQLPDKDAENFGIKPLPNLETRFIAANTLIGLTRVRDLTSAKALDIERQLRDNRERYFHATTRRQKLNCKRRDKVLRGKLAEELTGVGMPADEAEKIAYWDPYDQNASTDFFDTEWMFGIADGFDVVIGNPPYVDSEMMTKIQSELREVYRAFYESAKGNWDLFVVFIERGIQLQKENGIISYIVPNKLIGATYTKSLRTMLLDYSVLEIRDYSNVDVFKESDVYPVVFIIRKSERQSEVSMVVMDDLERSSIYNRVSAELFYGDIFWDRFFVSANQLRIIVKCSSFPALGRFCQIGAAATVGEAYAFKEYIREYSSAVSNNPFKKLINTGTIDRYESLWSKEPTRYIKSKYNAPIVFDSDLGRFSQRRFTQAQANKIIIGGMTKILECVYDEGEYIAGKSTVIVLESGSMNLKYVLALLNSKLVSFWYRIYFRSLALAGGYLRIGNNEIKAIPIPDVTSEQQAPIIEIVDRILAIKRSIPDADITALENEIDRVVYSLYNLTEEEIAIVEGATE